MRPLNTLFIYKRPIYKRPQIWALLCAHLFLATASAEKVDAGNAIDIVKNSRCTSEQSIEQRLDAEINAVSQRDLGWQVYKDDEYYDVERAFLVNKGMQIRYRWRLNSTGGMTATSKRAESLCTE